VNKRFKFGDVELEIGPRGFVLWDKEAGRWILDASVLKNERTLAISTYKDYLHLKKKVTGEGAIYYKLVDKEV
jgi:hypothetical protein